MQDNQGYRHTRGGVWGWQVGRPPQAPLLRGRRASGLWVCQAIFSGKLEMLIHAPFKNPSSRSISVVLYLDVFCTVIDIISVCGSVPIEIPILWPRAVMVGPRPRVLLTLPLRHTLRIRNTYCYSTATVVPRTRLILRVNVRCLSYSTRIRYRLFLIRCRRTMRGYGVVTVANSVVCVCYFVSVCVCWHVKGLILYNALARNGEDHD